MVSYLPVLDLFEFKTKEFSIGDECDLSSDQIVLTEKQVKLLEKVNSRYKFIDIDISRKQIKPKNFVGAIKVGDLTIQIFPKIVKGETKSKKSLAMGNLIRMLLVAEYIHYREIGVAEIDVEKYDFLEILMIIFSTKLLEVLKSNLYYNYRFKWDDLRYVRGRIDIAKYFSRPCRRHVIPCNFNDRTMDNLLNRTLKYTAYLMSRISSSSEAFRRLRKCMSILDPVELVPVSVSEADKIMFNRLNQVYKPLIEMAKIFLSGATIKLQKSHIETFTFLVPMEKLFERFITRLIELREVLPDDLKGAEIEAQKGIGYLAERNEKSKVGVFELIPDVKIEVNGKKFVIDLKYKLLDEQDRKLGVSQEDAYQMYAYATKVNADAVLLIYPNWGLENKIEAQFMFKTPQRDIPLYIRTIDLGKNLLDNDEWERFKEEVKSVFRVLVE